MYALREYADVNTVGTANLMEALVRHPVKRLVVASSMSVYGEGLYETADGRHIPGSARTLDQLRRGEWELSDEAGEPLKPVPTPETKVPAIASVYALSKYDQELLCLLTGAAYGISTVALRFFNVYGPRQSLSNPYTGVLAIFSSRLINDRPPLLFEDGYQRRDFVSVYDVAAACRLALEVPGAAGEIFNIGSGTECTIFELAERIASVVGKENIAPQVTGRYRRGDIRHCVADIRKARQVLGFEPKVKLEQGLADMATWLEGQIAVDRVDEATAELAERGLTV